MTRRQPEWLNTPNQLTMARFLFVPFAVIGVMEGHYAVSLGVFVLAGLTDMLDGFIARRFHQQSKLGEHLDPLADKLLLSSMFLTLSYARLIPWSYTILVFSRDLSILAVSAVLYNTTALRDFRPSLFGKANTFAQVATVFFVLLYQIVNTNATAMARQCGLYATLTFTILSGVHYVYLTGERLSALPRKPGDK